MDLERFYKNNAAIFPYQELGVLAIITSASLLESLINWVYSVPLNIKGEELEKIYWKGLAEKWTTLPKKYLEGYSISEPLKKDLENLIESRHAIIHNKPEVSYKDGSNLEGNIKNIFMNKENIVGKAFTLPFRLCENISNNGDRHKRYMFANGFYGTMSKQPGYKGFSMGGV